MTHLEIELRELKSETVKLFNLVLSQLEKSKTAMEKLDKDLAREVVYTERRVNSYELKIDRDSENLIALFNPVAADLRFVLATLKINTNLERAGDIAEGIAKFVIDSDQPFDKKLLKDSRVMEMFTEGIKMLEISLTAFETENTELVRRIFQQDEILDEVNDNANKIIRDYIAANPDKIMTTLNLLSVIRRLERVGDQTKNIAEEIIFYVEAKVLKHLKKTEKD